MAQTLKKIRHSIKGSIKEGRKTLTARRTLRATVKKLQGQ
jgi:hypothetical protein